MSGSQLTAVTAWTDEWLTPVLDQIYKRQPDAAVELLELARTKLGEAGFNADEHAAAVLMLARMEYFANRSQLFHDGISELTETTLADVEALPTPGPAARLAKAQVTLELKVIADRDNTHPLPAAEFDKLFYAIPVADRTPDLWYFISTWLFANRRLDQLEEGYEVLLTNESILRDFPFLRIKLMYQLLKGRITERELLLYIDNMPALNAMHEFSMFFMPVIEELGLASPELEEYVAAAYQRLRESPPESPIKQ